MISDKAYDNPRFRLKAALKGFTSALERLDAVTDTSATAENLFIAFTEALWWTVCVDDGFEDLAGSDQSYRPNCKDYQIARDNDLEGRVLRALRYARDRCGHQRAMIISAWSPILGMCLPKGQRLSVDWRSSVELPPPDPRFRNEKLRTEYDELLAGWSADEALLMAKIWFEKEQVRAQL